MKIGIFGSSDDVQCQALSQIIINKGAEVVIVESQALNEGKDVHFDGKNFYYQNQLLNDVKSWYLRYIMSPLPPAFEMSNRYYLFRDWFIDYMQRREKFGFQLSWLLSLKQSGIPIVNPPEHGSVVQLKPFQLHAAQNVGLNIPKTLITNNPTRVRKFVEEVGSVVYKPSMGGSLCRIVDQSTLQDLDLIIKAPVIFQKKEEGTSVRLTFVGNEMVSAVAIPSQSMDYRSDPVYSGGGQIYQRVSVPLEIIEKCRKLMQQCGLLFSGIDFIMKEDGSFIFLEANSSPIYMDIEQKTQNPITLKLADYLFKLGNEPEWYRDFNEETDLSKKSLLNYGNPFNPSLGIDDII